MTFFGKGAAMSFESHNRSDSSLTEKKKSSNVGGWIATIAALVLLAAAVSFPMWGSFPQLLNMVASGKSAPTPVTDTASDQGISIAIESASVEDGTSTIVVRLKDDDGQGRISDRIDFGHYSVQVGETYPASTISLLDYDAASDEARYAIAVAENLAGKHVRIDFYSIVSGEYSFYTASSDVDIAAILRDDDAAGKFGPLEGDLNGFGAKGSNGFAWHTSLTTNSNIGGDGQRPQGDVLEPNAIHVVLPDAQGAYLSNAAYSDGILYLQAAIPVGDAGECMLSVQAISRATGDYFPRSGDSFAYLYTGVDGTRLQIYETQCEVSPDDLADCLLNVNGFGNRGTTKGSWPVACTFPEEDSASDKDDSGSE